MHPKAYIKKTVAMQYDGTQESADAIALWLATFTSHKPQRGAFPSSPAFVNIDGQVMAPGDYVIRNMRDYPHVIAGMDFAATYEPAE